MFIRRVVFCRTFPMESSHEKFFVQLLYCNVRPITFDLSISFHNQLRPYRTFVQRSVLPNGAAVF